jgi:hypothetical protein
MCSSSSAACPAPSEGGEARAAVTQVKVGGEKVAINEYFKAHPEMVLGKHALTRGMHRDNELYG